MKKLFVILMFILNLSASSVYAEGMVIQGGVSLSDRVPEGFYGTWRVVSVQSYTNNQKIFTGTSNDYWNLSKSGDVITLTNPVSGAEASVTVEEVNGNQIKFVRKSSSKSEKVVETPALTLDGENFYGTDRIVIEKYKYGELVRTDIVEYKIKGTKISGSSAKDIFSKMWSN